MKKQLLIILAILFCSCGLVAQSPYARKVDLTQRGGDGKPGRVELNDPCVYIDPNSLCLDVAFSSVKSYTLKFKNMSGIIEFECNLITDGKNHTYYLPELVDGFYILVLESGDTVFQGKIFI